MSFQEHIDIDNLHLYAATNADTCKNPKGAVFQFHGLYDSSFGLQDEDFYKRCDEHNLLYIFTYGGQWNWMSEALVRTADRCAEVLFEKFGLAADTPIISTGHSMGGYGALMYTLNSKKNIIACAANCPVCDLYAFEKSEDVIPRTIIHALGGLDGSYDEIMQSHSPLYRVADMPDVPYYIVHGIDDASVAIGLHSDKFVPKMREAGRSVAFDRVPEMGHVAYPDDAKERYFDFIFSLI